MIGVDPAVDRDHGCVRVVRNHLRVQKIRLIAVARDDAEKAVGIDLVLKFA
jgi:hypothetical protein